MRRLLLAVVVATLPSAWLAASSSTGPAAPVAARAFRQDDFVRDPAVAARKLYDAWQKQDRHAAADYATDAAVARIFGLRVQPLAFTHCQRTGVGVFECVYRGAKDFEVWFRVTGGASAGYNVDSVSFSTD
ncbi:MAG TPA: hypothetical protein VNE16_13645 [Vicinamibacterales bacterium]|nr:hypothetical protein [Vicinamibacterales bacterium]